MSCQYGNALNDQINLICFGANKLECHLKPMAWMGHFLRAPFFFAASEFVQFTKDNSEITNKQEQQDNSYVVFVIPSCEV